MNSHRCPACDFIFLGDDAPEENCPECGEFWRGTEPEQVIVKPALEEHQSTELPLEDPQPASIPEESTSSNSMKGLVLFICLVIAVVGWVWQIRKTDQLAQSARGSLNEISELEKELETARGRLNEATHQVVDERESSQQVLQQFAALQEEFEVERQKFHAEQLRLNELERSLSALWEQHGHSHLRSWQIIGPFPFVVASSETSDSTDLAQLMAVETGILDVGYSQQAKFVGLRPNLSWQPYLSDNDRIDLRKACDFDQNAAAFAINWVFSRTEKEALLSVGSDDGMRLWFNRKQIHDVDTDRSSSPGQERIPVTLKAGWNEVLIRVDNRGKGDWNFFAEFKTPDNKSGIKLFHTWIAPQSEIGQDSVEDEPDESL